MMRVPEELIPIVLFIVIGFVAVGLPIARALARRMDRAPIAPPMAGELNERLARMEHAIDSIAVEVERISEGQRFTTKLLADRARDSRATDPVQGG